jgi:hypothetical protein
MQDRNATGFVNTYIYGAQLEIGSIATAYTPTTTSAITNTNNLYIPTGNIIGSPTVTGNFSVSGNLYISGTTTLSNIAYNDLTVSGGIVANNATFSDTVYANTIITNTPSVLSDISNQFDGTKCVFNLTLDQSNVISIMDSKNLEVVVGGARLSPYVKELRFPWITPYDSFKGFRVSSQNTASSVAQTLTIYNAPYQGEQAIVTIINSSSSPQTKKYPYSAATIALGD